MVKHTNIWFFLLLIAPFCMSCSARISGSLAENGSAELSASIALEPRITSLILMFAAAGGQTGGQILDGNAIARSMANAPGIASVSFRNTAPAAIEGPIRISKISEFLAAGGHEGFISFEQGPAGGKCSININRENGPEMLNYLAPEIGDYVTALMAPLATGDKLSKTEYLDLVGSIYNKAISDEIAGSRIRAAIDFPGPVTSIKGGTFFGKKAEFAIPLLDILVLEAPLHYEVAWR